MIKPLFAFLLFFCILQSHAQKLVYKSNGNILNSENKSGYINLKKAGESIKVNGELFYKLPAIGIQSNTLAFL